MVSELFVLYCAQSNFHRLHVKLIVKLGLPILHIVGPWRPNFKDFTVLLTILASTMLECITPNSIWENTSNSTKKYLQFWLSSVRKSFPSVHFTSFNWLQINQKVFANWTLTRSQSESNWPAHCSLVSLAEKQQRRSEFWEMEPLKNNRHLLT